MPRTKSKTTPRTARYVVMFESPNFIDASHYYHQHKAVAEAKAFARHVHNATAIVVRPHGGTINYAGRRVSTLAFSSNK